MSRGESARASRGASWLLALVLAAAFITPLSIRAVNGAVVGTPPGLGYLPALEKSTHHRPFDPTQIENLRSGRPLWVFIGDSMLGTRIDPIYLGELSATHDELVAFLYHPATGPAWWYLSFKNHFIASGITPRAVFVFFRDTNLTDTLFRVESLYGNALDDVAHADEPELNAVIAARKRGIWSSVHTAAVRAYGTDLASGWLEPGIRRWFVNWRFPDPGARFRFDQLLGERFDLANLRSDVAADLAGPNESANFTRDLPSSPLPLMIGLAKQHGVQLCFVRVQRRPRGTTPPPQSPNLLRYLGDLETYLAANGALYHDDWGDPELPESIYADGDHIRNRRHYTDVFRRRLDPLSMIFHSLDFAAFFLVVVSIYWRLPHRGQNLLLLGASYVFYGWVHPWFVLIMLASTTVDYWAGQRMEDDAQHKRAYLAASLAVNLGMLGVFKYFNFFIENVRDVLGAVGLTVAPPLLELALPAGISFYTFQALSYTVDVYKGEMAARRNPIDFALFVAFFPHLVAGPIMRAKNLLVQVEQPRVWNATLAGSGVVLVMWGLFKKLVIADNVGVIANRVFSQQDPAFEVLWAGVFAFGLQIYADFSAYSDIARGVARWFGFELVINFNHPYIAHSPTDFWRRWHISLSTWFRDYVYLPLGGNRGGAVVAACTLIATFLVSGFWHGASWNYVIWGFYHGLLVWGTRTVGQVLRLPEHWPGPLALVQVALTWVAMMAGWLFFRETNADFLGHFVRLSPATTMQGEAAIGLHFFMLAATWSLPLFLHNLWALARERQVSLVTWTETQMTGLRLAGVQAAGVGVLASLTLVLRSTTSLDFIYFAF